MKRATVAILVGLVLLAETWLVFRARQAEWVALFHAERSEGDIAVYSPSIVKLPWEELGPDHLQRISNVLARMDEEHRSIDVLERLLNLHPDDRDLRWELATRLAESGRREEAALHYDDLLEKQEIRP